MSLHNPWFALALFGTLAVYHLELIATLLNMSALKTEPPEPLRDVVNADDHERTLEYARVRARIDVLESSASLGLFIAFWLGGGFSWLDVQIKALHLAPIPSGLCVIAAVMLLQTLAGLPFEIYDTFVTEQGFGFNKTTPFTFAMDRVKGLALSALIGAPLVALLLWLFGKFEFAALYGWIIVSGFSLLMAWLAPRFVLPLFYKFRPLDDATLRERIMELSKKLSFPVAEVSVVDGSKRSTKANAFFTGFGKLKRIALFDTLLQNHDSDEILAVLAHEIGHCKRGHVPRQIALSFAITGVMFALLHFGLRDARLCSAFGVAPASTAWGFVFFGIMLQPLNVLFGMFSTWLSRRHEYEADAFARESMGGAAPMIRALKKLSRDHLSNATPHPFYVALHYSHPPVLARMAALDAAGESR